MFVRTVNLHEVVTAIKRRRWLVLLPFAFGLALTPLLARLVPERYRSEALLLVIPQQVPNDYVTPTMSQRRAVL